MSASRAVRANQEIQLPESRPLVHYGFLRLIVVAAQANARPM